MRNRAQAAEPGQIIQKTDTGTQPALIQGASKTYGETSSSSVAEQSAKVAAGSNTKPP